ncbi:hypothetical protein [Hydrogenophaga aquatica]
MTGDEEIHRLGAEHWARPVNEYHLAVKFHALPVPPESAPDKTQDLILEAFKSPVRLPDGAFSFDKNPLKRTGRGRPFKRSRYDDFIDALRGAIQRQARLPRLRVGAKKQGSSVEIATREIAEIVARISPKERVTAPKVWNRLNDRRVQRLYCGPMVSEWTIQKVLADLRRKGLIPK